MKIDINEVITLDNIEELSKTIAVETIKTYLNYCYIKEVYNMYKNLIADLNNEHNIDYTFSKGYDLVSEAKLCLFQNLGKKLNDKIEIETRGKYKTFTVIGGCHFLVRRIVSNELYTGKKCINIYDNTLEKDFIYNQFEEYEESRNKDDWSNVERIIEKLNLNDMEKETLECFLMGCTYAEAKEILNRCYASIFERREKIRKKYLAVMG